MTSVYHATGCVTERRTVWMAVTNLTTAPRTSARSRSSDATTTTVLISGSCVTGTMIVETTPTNRPTIVRAARLVNSGEKVKKWARRRDH